MALVVLPLSGAFSFLHLCDAAIVAFNAGHGIYDRKINMNINSAFFKEK